MDGVIGPAVAAGGRLGAALLRRPKLRRKASLKISASAFLNGATSNVELTIENPRKNLDSITVTSISPMIRVHDQSCGEPEFVLARKGQHGDFPRCPIDVRPGESIRWSAKLHVRDIEKEYERLVVKAMQRTWGEGHAKEILDRDQQEKRALGQETTSGKLVRLLHAIDEPAPQLIYLVETKQDGQYSSSLLRPTQMGTWDRLRIAWNQ